MPLMLWLPAQSQNMPPASIRNKMGYFVLTNGAYMGADVTDNMCFNDLQTFNWKGKQSAGVLTISRVRVFACNVTTCSSLKPSTYYTFANAGNSAMGGAVMGMDMAGQGPADNANWAGAGYFGISTNYWSGPRGNVGSPMWSNISLGGLPHCSNWTVSFGQSGQLGSTSATDANRWNSTVDLCNNPYRMICIVDPE